MKTPLATNLLLSSALFLATLSVLSCNKDVPEPVPNILPTPTGSSLGDLLEGNPEFSLMRAALIRAGMMPQLQDDSRTFTLFAPDNSAFALSGLPTEAAIEAMPMTRLVPLMEYHLSPQRLTSKMIPNDKANMPYPSLLNPSPTTHPLSRSYLFPSTRNGVWVNSAPVKAVDEEASNGCIHTIGRVLEPPTRTFWERIGTDPGMTYLRGTILKADSGLAPTDSRSLVYLLSNNTSNLTFLVPREEAFIVFYSRLFRDKLVSMGYPYDIASSQAAAWAVNPSLIFKGEFLPFYISSKSLRELLLYHMLSGVFYQNNFSAYDDRYETLLIREPVNRPSNLVIEARFWAGQSVLPNVTIWFSYGYTKFSLQGPANQPFTNGVLHTVDSVMTP